MTFVVVSDSDVLSVIVEWLKLFDGYVCVVLRMHIELEKADGACLSRLILLLSSSDYDDFMII